MLPSGLHTVALGNASQFEVCLFRTRMGLVVGIIGKGCYKFNIRPDAGYIEEKLKVRDGDAMNMADFVQCQLGGDPAGWGDYHERLCSDYRPSAATEEGAVK